jgi:hypothetical protein
MFGEFGFPGVSPSGGAPSHSAPRAVETMQTESLFRQRNSLQLTQYHRIFTDGPGLGVWTFGPVAPQTNRLLIGGLRVPSLNPGDSCRCCVRCRAKHVCRRQLASAGGSPLSWTVIFCRERWPSGPRAVRGPRRLRTSLTPALRAPLACVPALLSERGARPGYGSRPSLHYTASTLQRWLCRRRTRP